MELDEPERWRVGHRRRVDPDVGPALVVEAGPPQHERVLAAGGVVDDLTVAMAVVDDAADAPATPGEGLLADVPGRCAGGRDLGHAADDQPVKVGATTASPATSPVVVVVGAVSVTTTRLRSTIRSKSALR